MLVLSRKPGQEIVVGDDIEFKILSVRGNTVKVGIIAPGQSINRREIFDKIKGESDDDMEIGTLRVSP